MEEEDFPQRRKEDGLQFSDGLGPPLRREALL
jgi:hypothetical protein